MSHIMEFVFEPFQFISCEGFPLLNAYGCPGFFFSITNMNFVIKLSFFMPVAD